MSPTRQERDELYRKHAAGAFRRAQRLLGSAADAGEVVHDVFIALFERPERYRGGAMSAYVYGAVTHACLNRLRNLRTRQRLTREHELMADLRVDPGTAAETSFVARATLAMLPEPLAQVAVYYYVDELSHREIAEVLGCSHRHVGNLLARLKSWAETQEQRACR